MKKSRIAVMISVLLLLAVSMTFGMNAFAAEEEKTSLAGAEVYTAYDEYYYRGVAREPNVGVKLTTTDSEGNTKEIKLKRGRDYEVTYKNNVNIGKAKIVVNGIGKYKGKAVGYFRIIRVPMTETTVSTVRFATPGNAPKYKVTFSGMTLKEGEDYTLTVKNNNVAGYKQATVILKGMGNYKGRKVFKAAVKPRQVRSIKATSISTDKISLTWTSYASEGVTGYDVYSVNKNGGSKKFLKRVYTNAATVTGLSSGTEYYFRVQAFTKTNTSSGTKTVYGHISNSYTICTRPEYPNIKYAYMSGRNKLYVEWDAVECSGYEIQYTTDKKWKKDVHTVYAGYTRTSKTISVDNDEDVYYVAIRAYKYYKNKNHWKYGKWSWTVNTEFSHRYEYYTTKYVNNPNRTNNLMLACAAIDGTILAPGETFSFNSVVGKRTEAKGYKPAPIFTGSSGHTDGIGGGICQVASTMFNASLWANFDIVERHQHSQRVTYCPLGRDAAIYWGSYDYKFRNNTDYPILIRMDCGDGELTCSFYTSSGITPGDVKLNVAQSGKKFTLTRTVNKKVNYTAYSTY